MESFVTRTSRTPLLSIFGAFVNDWVPLINDYYYCKPWDLLVVDLFTHFKINTDTAP